LPVEYKPGTWFVYNTAGTYMLSAILTKLTGESLAVYLRPRLFEPLGIENPFWETDPGGINLGGSGLHAKTEDIARFGQMYLQKGMWYGKRIVTEEWIAEATKPHSDNSNTRSIPIGLLAMAISSGVAGTTAIAAMEPSANTASSCLGRMRCWP
jgi:CubicO group peptidase (beta-lactamase class C family)